MTMEKILGSIWIECDGKGEAECPHCQTKAYFRDNKWAGCKHSIGPGTVEKLPAMIFQAQKDK